MGIGDPEHYKPYYADEWGKHKKDVDELQQELETRFDLLKGRIKRGFGTTTTEYLQMTADQKAEASITLVKKFDQDFCCIWVSGSDKINMKESGNIWIRPDKIEAAEVKNHLGQKCWFYMKYKNATYVLPLETVIRYRKQVSEKNLRGPKEHYVIVPASEAKPVNELYSWLASVGP